MSWLARISRLSIWMVELQRRHVRVSLHTQLRSLFLTDGVQHSEEDASEDNGPYCVCGGGIWGEMVGCDSGTCQRDWFHLDCVGLQEAPPADAKWYCSEYITTSIEEDTKTPSKWQRRRRPSDLSDHTRKLESSRGDKFVLKTVTNKHNGEERGIYQSSRCDQELAPRPGATEAGYSCWYAFGCIVAPSTSIFWRCVAFQPSKFVPLLLGHG